MLDSLQHTSEEAVSQFRVCYDVQFCAFVNSCSGASWDCMYDARDKICVGTIVYSDVGTDLIIAASE